MFWCRRRSCVVLWRWKKPLSSTVVSVFITRDFKDHSTLHICCNFVEIMQAEGFLTFRLLTKIHEVEIKLPHKYAPFFSFSLISRNSFYIHSWKTSVLIFIKVSTMRSFSWWEINTNECNKANSWSFWRTLVYQRTISITSKGNFFSHSPCLISSLSSCIREMRCMEGKKNVITARTFDWEKRDRHLKLFSAVEVLS